MNIDIFSRLPNNILDNYEDVYADLTTINTLVLNKYREVTAIRLVSYLERAKDYLEYNVSLKLLHDIHNNFYYFKIKCFAPSKGVESDYVMEDKIRKLILIPEVYLANLFKLNNNNNDINFINNEEGRDQLLYYMIGSHWQQWKKEGEIIENYEKISSTIPNKKAEERPKKKI